MTEPKTRPPISQNLLFNLLFKIYPTPPNNNIDPTKVYDTEIAFCRF